MGVWGRVRGGARAGTALGPSRKATGGICSRGPKRDNNGVIMTRPDPSSPRPRQTARANRQSDRPTKADRQKNADRQSNAGRGTGDGPVWLYGRHATAAALANPARTIIRLAATRNGADWLAGCAIAPERLAGLEDLRPDAIDKLLHDGAVHQGIALLAEPLPRARLKDVCADPGPGDVVLVLDQITDPQNIGALMRSGAAFGARAVIVQERRTPPLAGALAKAAAGAIEAVPCVQAVNIARSLDALKGLGWHVGGLAGTGAAPLAALPAGPTALVLGAEGKGLRQLVGETCDALYRIPIAPAMESLNVSNAAAIALYAATANRFAQSE